MPSKKPTIQINPSARAEHLNPLWERVPGGNSLPFSCFANAEIWAAEHGLAAQKGEYSKVRCSAHEFATGHSHLDDRPVTMK